MISVLSILALGFFLGMRHATDPDHVVAVSTIVARHRSLKDAALVGAVWGLGHTMTILAVGGGIILLGWVIPARVGLSMEFSVGLMLILLGIMNVSGFARDVSASHGTAHVHEEETATQLTWFERHFGFLGIYQVIRPLGVGIVHGLAGSAAVALLVLTTIRDPRWAVAYLLLFGIGTIAGMMLITQALALPFAYARNRRSWAPSAFRIASGLISLGFGLFLAYQIGFINGLLSGHPQWTPR